jgi:hypothetical protein
MLSLGIEAARLLDRQRERRIPVRIAATLASRDRDRAGELGEVLAAPRIDDRLLVLDRMPFRVTGHDPKSSARASPERVARRPTGLFGDH